MRKCIRSWLDEYKNKYYVRLSIIDKASGSAVGTIEIFDNFDKAKSGAAFHIDLSVSYETRVYISELLTLANKEFFQLFGFEYLYVRAVPSANERIAALQDTGYESLDRKPGREHFYMKGNTEYGA